MYGTEEIKQVQARLLEMAKATKAILEKNDIPYFITYGTLLGAIRHKGFIPWDDDFDFYLLDESYEEAIELLRRNLPADMFLEDEYSEPLYFHGWAHVKDLKSEAECCMFPQDSSYAHKGISIDLYRTRKVHEFEDRLYRIEEHIKYLYRRDKVKLMKHEDFLSRLENLQKEWAKEIKRISLLDPQERDTRLMYAFPSGYKDRLFMEDIFPLKQYTFEDTSFLGPNDADLMLKRCYGDYMTLPPMEKRLPHYSSIKFFR